MHDLITNFDEAMRYTKFLLDNGIITVEELRASYDERTGRKSTTTETPAENAESPVETITDAEAGSAVISRVGTVSGSFALVSAGTEAAANAFYNIGKVIGGCATASLDKAKIDNLKVKDNQVSELITRTFDLSDGKDRTWIVGAKNGYTPLFVSKDEDGKIKISVFNMFK